MRIINFVKNQHKGVQQGASLKPPLFSCHIPLALGSIGWELVVIRIAKRELQHLGCTWESGGNEFRLGWECCVSWEALLWFCVSPWALLVGTKGLSISAGFPPSLYRNGSQKHGGNF